MQTAARRPARDLRRTIILTTELHEILYCSQLAPGQPHSVVAQIIAQARARNPARGITGLLVFDGIRFCQHFEGPREAVLKLMARLDFDARHVDLKVLYEGPIAERRYPRFEMGLAPLEDSDDIALLAQLDDTAALERFMALRPRFDLGG